MRLPLNLFGFHGADNRAAPLSSAAFAALPSPVQSTLFSDVPQAHVASDAYSPTYPPAEQYANFSSGPIDTDLGSLGLGWNGDLLNESTASPHQTTSYDGAYLSTAGPSSFDTYALPDATEPEPAYYPPNYSAATSNLDDVECGFSAYLPESANPSFLSDRSAWVGPAPEELSQPEERPIPEGTACPEDCFDMTGLPSTPPAPLYDSPLQTRYNTSPSSYNFSPSTAPYNFSPLTASYGTSPSTASFDSGLSEQYPAPYSPVATSAESCSPTRASRAKPVLPPIAYNSSPSAASYDTSPSTVSYDTSPSAASFDGSFFEQHPALYSPVATSVDSCSPTRASRAKPVLPPTRIAYNSSPSAASYDTSPSTASFDGSLFGHNLSPYSPVATSVDSCSPTWPSSAKPVMSPSQLAYNTSPSTASYDTSPSTAFFDGSLSGQYSPVATSVDSCSPTWPSSAKPVMPPSQTTYNTSPSTASYDTSPSTASFDGSPSEQYRSPYSPVATSTDSYVPPSSAKLVQPPSGTSLGRPVPYAAIATSSWPVASSSKRRCVDEDVLEMPRTKRVKEVGEYQGLVWPPPVAGSSKRRLEDDEESVDEPLMKKMRKMKNKKRPARSAETRARRVSSEALRRHKTLVVGPADCGNTTSDTRNEIHAHEVEGPEQTPSGSSSQTTQVENATPASSRSIQAAPAPKRKLRCPQEGECGNKTGFNRPAELNRHLLSVHTSKLKCPHGCPISRRDALSRHLKDQHGWEAGAAARKARSIDETTERSPRSGGGSEGATD